MPRTARKTWTVLRAEARTFLEDKTQGRLSWSDAELMLYLNWGLQDLSTYVPRQRRHAYESTETNPFLPEDFYLPLYVEFPYKQFIEEARNVPGTQYYSQGTLSSGSLPNVWTRDSDQIYLWREPGGTWYLHYLAYYPEVETDGAEILVPRWAYRALVYFIAAQAISKDAIGEAQLNRWKTKRDSGKPTDSALTQEAARLMEEYRTICLSHVSDQDILHINRPMQRVR